MTAFLITQAMENEVTLTLLTWKGALEHRILSQSTLLKVRRPE